MAESTNAKTPEWIQCSWLRISFFKIFASHCFHEIFRVPIFSIQILFKGSLQSCNKSLINQACSGPYWENISPWSFLCGPRCTRSVLSRPRADILPVGPLHLVNKIYIIRIIGSNKLVKQFYVRNVFFCFFCFFFLFCFLPLFLLPGTALMFCVFFWKKCPFPKCQSL